MFSHGSDPPSVRASATLPMLSWPRCVQMFRRGSGPLTPRVSAALRMLSLFDKSPASFISGLMDKACCPCRVNLRLHSFPALWTRPKPCVIVSHSRGIFKEEVCGGTKVLGIDVHTRAVVCIRV